MSYVNQQNGAAPATPATGTTQYVDTDGRTRAINSTGVNNLLTGEDPVNYIRNSGMWFAQRQAPATLTTISNVGGRHIVGNPVAGTTGGGPDGFGVSNENASVQYRRVDTSGAAETNLTTRFWGEFTKITATGKIAVTQAIEAGDAQSLRGKSVRLQFWAKAIIGTPLTLKFTILNWTGTVDVVPSGAGLMLSAFGANGADPTLAANFAFIAPKSGVTPENATAATNSAVATGVTTTWTRFGAVFDIPTTARNLIVMIWSDNQIIATNGYGLSQVALTEGMEIQDWSPLDYLNELSRIRRYACKTFALDTAPAQSGGVGGALREGVRIAGAVATSSCLGWRFPMAMFRAPTLLFYNPSAANAFARNVPAATDATATSGANITTEQADINCTGLAAWTVGQELKVHAFADAEI